MKIHQVVSKTNVPDKFGSIWPLTGAHILHISSNEVN